MNSCNSDQVLAKAGHQQVTLPQTQTRAINKELRATHWECQRLNNISYLQINYAAGLGNSPNDEAIEYYSLNLTAITDKAIKRDIIRHGTQTSEAAINSIMPTGNQANGNPAQSTSRLELIENLTKNPTILTQKWFTLKKLFKKCNKLSTDTKLNCINIDGIRNIDLIEGPTGNSTIEFNSPTTCEEIYTAASKNLGKGIIRSGYCDAEWNLRKIKNGLSATLYNSPKDPTRIFFMIGFEQGP